MSLTNAQRNALRDATVEFGKMSVPFGTAESVDQRARQPDPDSLPADVTVRIEIAPPAHPHPLLATKPLKTPEHVPLYFYALRDDRVKTGAEPEPEEIADTRVIFFIHGGGNLFGHPTDPLFLPFYAQLLRAVAAHSQGRRKCVLVAPSYRLATVTENTFPAGLQDIVSAYNHIIGRGYKASNITVAGDSAGGNYAVVLTHLIIQSDRPSPGGVIAIAPFQPYDHSSESAKAQADQGNIPVVPPLFSIMTSAFLGNSGIARTDPLVSGTFIPFTPPWPETLILVGAADPQIYVSRELEKRLRTLNLPVELVEYDELPHGWWVMAHILPDDVQDAAQRIARFALH